MNDDLISRQAAIDEMTLTLNSPITEEQWDAITDVDFEHTNEIAFHTKHGKEVKFVKASAQTEQIRCKECLMHGVCRFEQGLGLDGFCSKAERRTDEPMD